MLAIERKNEGKGPSVTIMGNGAWRFLLNDVIGLGPFARVFAFRNQRAVTTFSNSNEQTQLTAQVPP